MVAVAAGQNHTLSLTDDGHTFSWGIGTDGVLGHGDEQSCTSPRVISGLCRGVALAAGAQHSLVVTHDGMLYSFGCGDHGRLGHGDRRGRSRPCSVCFSGSLTSVGTESSHALVGFRVATVAAGETHSLAVTGEGAVFSWGMGGRLGLGCDDSDRLQPAQIHVLAGVLMVAAGQRHSLAVTAAGRLYTFYDEPGYMVPRLVECMRSTRVVMIAAGWFMSLAVSEEGVLSALMFSGGECENEYGQHGQHGQLGALVMAPPPRTLRGKRIAAVCAGENHALLMLEEGEGGKGEVLAFGSGDYGKLGLGDEEEEQRLTPCWVPAINK
jgi:alpha-tubulin suppressor-like RCC1 family protein